jgi:hypothetical protein
MQNIIKKYLAGLAFFSLALFVGTIINNTSYEDINTVRQSAAIFNPSSLPADALPASGFAWNDNVGWINFGDENSSPTGRVYVSNNKLYGYAWGENIGWISMTCENDTDCTNEYGVTQNDSDGTLTGYAWGENIGWIDFAPTGGGVSVSTSTSSPNTLTGYAWGENIGWISFSGTSPDYGVTTTWAAEEITIGAISSDSLTFPYKISRNATTSFSAIVTGRDNTDVIWSLPSEAGIIDEDGLYTASTTPGDYTLTATTDVDPSVSTTTIITIKSGATPPPPGCIYNEAVWSDCTNSSQTRTLTATNQTCVGEDPKVETQSCTMPINISIEPITSTIYIGDIIQFSATITGTTTNNEVLWTVLPIETIIPDFYGHINNEGKYFAPMTASGTINVTIKATAKADNSKSATAEVVIRLKPPCTGYTYSNWGACINEVQTRTASTSIPTNCSGGAIATTSQACTMATTTATTTIMACTGYTYSDWSTCLNNSQSRNTLTSVPTNCIGGDRPVTEQTCTVEPTTIIPDGLQNKLDSNGDLIPGTDTKNTSRGGGSHSSGDNKTGIAAVDNIVSALDVSSFVTNNVAVLGTTTERIILGAQKVLESPAGAAVAQTITTVGVVGGGVAATGVFALNGTAIADLLFLPFKLWGLLLSALGLKKRNRPWGTVYDSVTKQPIDPAYVTITNVENKKDETSITDLDGRYGFLVAPGKYILAANKTNYVFPSKKLAGKTEDALYNNLYFGEEINTPVSGAVISKNIPLDPVKFDWNEFTKGKKKLMKFYSRRDKVLKIVTDWIFRIGFGVSLLSLFLVSAPYNLIIFGLYLVLTALRKFGLKQKTVGSLTDKEGNPLSFAIVRVFDSELNVQIVSKVANQIGKYYCLVNKGKYYVKIERKNDDESYTEVFTSPVINAEDGIINKSFII